jgi:HlyD family secretion protein
VSLDAQIFSSSERNDMASQTAIRSSNATAPRDDARLKRSEALPGDANERRPSVTAAPRSRGGWWTRIGLTVLAAAIIGGGIFLWMRRSRAADLDKGRGAAGESAAAEQDETKNKAALRVNVIRPHQGGMARTTTQPGTFHAFQYADLFAKASGYLRAQVVDIGDTVEKGQLLAEIYDPERQQEVEVTAAEVERSKAAVEQAKAMLTAAEAEVTAAEATVDVRKTEISQTAAIRRFREKEYIRYLELARHQAVDQRVADEKQEDYEGAKAAEEKAHAAVKAAEADLARDRALVLTAKADVQHARAQQRVAEAKLGQATILAQYTRILSPYTGVVTQRNFHDGDFIREAIRADEAPILSVARTDLMRVVVYVPDRDTSLLNRGDEAVVRVDALAGEEFKGKVMRYSEIELPANRTMRTEIDLPNPTGRLRMGMYGAVSILLEPPTDFLTIPSKALHQLEAGAGVVFLAKDGRAHKTRIRIGRDNGVLVEVISGLTINDQVIIGYTGSIQDGEPVDAAAGEGIDKAD